MRKLTVKNFSVIKEAELEFGKITVLIGPQSSGKSLLCKLAFFLGQLVPEIANGLLLLSMSSTDLKHAVANEFIERFPKEAWGVGSFEISFQSKVLCVTVRRDSPSSVLSVDFDVAFLERYREWAELHGAEVSASNRIRSLRTGSSAVHGPIVFDESVYIPTGRSFFSTPNRGFASFSGKNLDWVTQRFAADIDWEYKSLMDFAGPSSEVFPQFLEDASGIVGGKVVREGGVLLFRSSLDGRKLPFQLLSSGTLELLPLLNPLGRLVFNVSTSPLRVWTPPNAKLGPIFMEEPELSVFPKTQYNLMRLLAWLSNDPQLDFSFVVTTHSPYILSSFNNLIYAGQLGENEALRNEISIPERYWIKRGDFAAYAMHDGLLSSILSESGLIDGEYLDGVSETIGNEFDKLLRLEYDQTEAS